MAVRDQQWLHDNALNVLDSVVDAIITINADGIIQSVNRSTQRLFGYDGDELLGKPITMLMPEPHRSRHQSYVDHYLQTREAKIIGIGRELTAVTKAGEVFPIYLAATSLALFAI